ncbi:NUDIX hydrolase [Deltaproteobacteria bacterium]|nr:NUDIX hydrolase [Deltaproteobacteria bacterium]
MNVKGKNAPSGGPCPVCGRYRAPSPTVDALIHDPQLGIVLVRRKNIPLGWALPGGFVDYGETVENAVTREAKEETNLDVSIQYLLGVYSDPGRDKRRHTISAVFVATALNGREIMGGDDASAAVFFPLDALPQEIVFDHRKIIDDFLRKEHGNLRI